MSAKPGELQDLFANYISEILGDDFEIWIDPQLSIPALKNKSGKRTLVFRPDLCVVRKRKKRIELLFDFKMDLGYKRNNFIEQVSERAEELNVIREKTAKWSQRKQDEFSFNKKVVWDFVVISTGNMSKKNLHRVLEASDLIESVNIYFLVDGEHPNTYANNYEPAIRFEDFRRLRKRISSVISLSLIHI